MNCLNIIPYILSYMIITIIRRAYLRICVTTVIKTDILLELV